MKLEKSDYDLIFKKLEYKFKNSGNPLVEKIKSNLELSNEEIEVILKKLEYTFRKGGNPIIKKLSTLIGNPNYSPILYSNLKAKTKKELKQNGKS